MDLNGKTVVVTGAARVASGAASPRPSPSEGAYVALADLGALAHSDGGRLELRARGRSPHWPERLQAKSESAAEPARPF